MAQPIQNITLGAPGFWGVNTQDSPVGMNNAYAQIANNCVIDKFGRLGARKGFATLTSDNTPLGGVAVTAIHEFRTTAGDDEVFCAGNNKLFRGDTTTTDLDTLTEIVDTSATHSFTGDNFVLESFNDYLYAFQKGDDPVLLDTTLNSADEYQTVTSKSSDTADCPQAGFALGAYGRMWLCDISGEESIVYWSDLYIGYNFESGSSGSIDVTQAWPAGYDEVKAVASFNDALVIFGKDNTLVYSGATNPSTMVLTDTIVGIGCVEASSIKSTGDDLIFLSSTGLRSLGRTIQEKSRPLNSLSRNIRSDLIDAIGRETSPIRACYSPEEALYLLHFQDQEVVFCFDTRGLLENGSLRVTIWPGALHDCGFRRDNGQLILGGRLGLGRYIGYEDNGGSYQMSYFGPVMTFGDSSKLKILKRIRPTFVGGNGQNSFVKWGYGYKPTFNSGLIGLPVTFSSEYGIAEYAIAEYGGAGSNVTNESINADGSGPAVTVGVEITIQGGEFSIQEINVLTLIGKVL